MGTTLCNLGIAHCQVCAAFVLVGLLALLLVCGAARRCLRYCSCLYAAVAPLFPDSPPWTCLLLAWSARLTPISVSLRVCPQLGEYLIGKEYLQQAYSIFVHCYGPQHPNAQFCEVRVGCDCIDFRLVCATCALSADAMLARR